MDHDPWHQADDGWGMEDVRAAVVAMHTALIAGQQSRQSGHITDRVDPRAWQAMLAHTRAHPRTTVFDLLCSWRAFLLGCGPHMDDEPEHLPPPGWYLVDALDTLDRTDG
jgi:hypothetical protein